MGALPCVDVLAAETMANHNQYAELVDKGRPPRMVTRHQVWTLVVLARHLAASEELASLYPSQRQLSEATALAMVDVDK